MGKIQKLKAQKKLEEEEFSNQQRKKKWSLILIIIPVLLIGFLVIRRSPNTAIPTDNSKQLGNPKQTAILDTNLGQIKIELFDQEAPQTVANFIKLANENFYDGVKFHRVIKDFMIQTGDPNSKDNDWSDDGTGGPGYTFADEINSHLIVKGSVAMANNGSDTNGSQFFIVTATSTPWLDGLHTNFGRVIEGINVVEKISEVKTNTQDHPLSDVIIEKIQIISN